MSEPAATPNKHANHERKDLAQYASAKFEKGIHLLHKSKFEMARNKFRSAQKARILLHDDVYHITIAPGYEILGHVNLALGDWEEAKLNLLAAQEICEKNLDLLGNDTGEKQDMRDLLRENILRIQKGLELVEVRRSEESHEVVKPFDATIIKRISGDMTIYSNLNVSSTRTPDNNVSLESIHEASKEPKHTAKCHEHDTIGVHRRLLFHDALPATDNIGQDESITILHVDNLHGSASPDAPTWMSQDESPPNPFSSLDVDVQAAEKRSKIIISTYPLPSNDTFAKSSFVANNVNGDSKCIIYHNSSITDGKFSSNQPIHGEDVVLECDTYSTDVCSGSSHSPPVISATIRRASSIYVDQDEEIFVPEAIAVERDEDIPQASVVIPEKTCFTSTVYGRKILVLVIIAFIALALLIGFLVNAALKKIYVNIPMGKNKTSITEIKNSIESHVLQRNATFHYMGRTNPRLLALEWILNQDEMHLTLSDSNLYQRYILALLAFRFSSLEWTNWLTGTDECEWHGVTCDDDGTVVGLEIADNNWFGDIPPEIFRLEYLQHLALVNSCLYGTLPPELGNMKRLKDLNLTLNRLNGYIPDELYNLSSLVRIDLSYQDSSDGNTHCDSGSMGKPTDESLGLEGSILENIWRLKDLQEIILNDNYFSGTIAHEIGNLKQLEILNVRYNAFGGTIPSVISRLSNMRELWLELNWFTGSLPQSIGEATALEVLSVYSNIYLTGTIPDSLYKLANLKHLCLDRGGFEGSIKSEIGNLKELTFFSVANNQFTGTLPSELGLCEKLETVQIDNTSITGTVPQEVCALTLKRLNSEDPNVEYLKADCFPENEVGEPFISCDCCNVCCDHTANECHQD